MIFRPFFFALGWLSLGLGVLGAFLPVLPTTPFILLSAFCFSKSSPRLHRWMLASPFFGPTLHDWQNGGVIRLPAKLLATFFVVTSFTSLTLYSNAPRIGKVLLDLFGVGVLGFIWSRPSTKIETRQL